MNILLANITSQNGKLEFKNSWQDIR